jgi:hypothetical protein
VSAAAPAGDNARCPRCGSAFHCGANDPTPCACASLTLDAELLRTLRERYDRCLCVGCLAQLAGAGTSPLVHPKGEHRSAQREGAPRNADDKKPARS